MSQLNKSFLRRTILEQRQSLSVKEWQLKSNLICDRLQTWTQFQAATTIFAYFSFRQEVDLTPLFKLNKNWAFPRCVGQSLVWHLWQPGAKLNRGKYGISEPCETATIVDLTAADLILVPTVAIDNQGYRLGYGGGFYDRLLSTESGLKITTVGIVFDFAHGVQFPKDPWDRSLDFTCTEMTIVSYS